MLRYADDGVRAEKRFLFHDNGVFDASVEVERLRDWSLLVGPGIRNPSEAELKNRFERRSAVYETGDDLKRLQPNGTAEREELPAGALRWVGLEDTYFLTALIPQQPLRTVTVIPYLAVPSNGDGWIFRPLPPKDELTDEEEDLPRDLAVVITPIDGSIDLRAYWGAKKYQRLADLPYDLERTVTIWSWLRPIAVPILWALLWIHDNLVHNYGWAIVLVTILIKLLLSPLTHKSFVSMRKMQKLNPQMQAIRAKWRGKLRDKQGKMNLDAQRQMNEEMQNLYKTAGVNPAGGCLPMILQMPVLFAFYQLLTASVELRGQPWILWITDLTQPFWPLAVVMGATQFIQQRMTPMAGDPMQRRLMQAMPLVWTLFFLKFPSGLVLYWLTNNVLTILQQGILNRILSKHDDESAPDAQGGQGAQGEQGLPTGGFQMSKRKFFSGNSVRQAVVSAASHFDLPPDEVAFREVDKKHGFLKLRKRVIIEVDADDPRRPPLEIPAIEREPGEPARGGKAMPRGDAHRAGGADLQGPPGERPVGVSPYDDADDEDDEHLQPPELRDQDPEVAGGRDRLHPAPSLGGGRGRGGARKGGGQGGRGGDRKAGGQGGRGGGRGQGGGRADAGARAQGGGRSGSGGRGRTEDRPAPPAPSRAAEDQRGNGGRGAGGRGDGGRGGQGGRGDQGGRGGQGGDRRESGGRGPGSGSGAAPAAKPAERGDAGRPAGDGGGSRRRRRGRGRGRGGRAEDNRSQGGRSERPQAAGREDLVELPERSRSASERYQEARGELADACREGLDRILDVAGIDVDYQVFEGDGRFEVELSGADEALVLAEGGDLLRAIEHLVPRAMRGVAGESTLVRVNCGDFHEIHEERLRSQAQQVAAEVRRSQRPSRMEPMSPADRRIVHVTLADEPGVSTVSDGNGHYKQIVVKPV